MKTGIFYSSNSGNTLLVAEEIGRVLAAAGHEVALRSVSEADAREARSFELCLFGSPSWLRDGTQGELTQAWEDFAAGLRGGGQLTERNFAVFGLGRHEYTHFAGAVDHLERLVKDLDGNLVVESLRFDGFPHHRLDEVRDWANQLAEALEKTPA